jgi:hypothetical protein
MCSGTESPILALEMVISRKWAIPPPLSNFMATADNRCIAFTELKRIGVRSFEFKHLFSAEIVEFKQAFIERNFHPPILFKDVKELHQNEAYVNITSLEKENNSANL